MVPDFSKPDEKAKELLRKYGKDAAMDEVKTFQWYCVEFNAPEWFDYWAKVFIILKSLT